jgi:hypothetical protein
VAERNRTCDVHYLPHLEKSHWEITDIPLPKTLWDAGHMDEAASPVWPELNLETGSSES